MNVQGIAALLGAGTSLGIALFMLWRHSTQRLHRFFSLQIVGAALYAFFLYGLATASNQASAALWMRYGMGLVYATLFTFY